MPCVGQAMKFDKLMRLPPLPINDLVKTSTYVHRFDKHLFSRHSLRNQDSVADPLRFSLLPSKSDVFPLVRKPPSPFFSMGWQLLIGIELGQSIYTWLETLRHYGRPSRNLVEYRGKFPGGKSLAQLSEQRESSIRPLESLSL